MNRMGSGANNPENPVDPVYPSFNYDMSKRESSIPYPASSISYYTPAFSRILAAIFVCSQVNSGSVRPKCP
jgi:hypothetical protein